MGNRLKLMRKVKHKTQQEIANYIGITQNAYSYWENGKVRVDNESLTKLANYYNVSLDFLSGQKFYVTYPVNLWYADLQEDYYNSDDYQREYMEYRHGKVQFSNPDIGAQSWQSSSGIQIPVLGKVAAGIPISAITDILDYEEISPDMIKDGSEYFALSIKGDSMEPKISEGDVVIVKKQENCESGQIAIVQINGDEATCKKLVKKSNGIVLQSFNPAYEPMYFSDEEIEDLPLKVIGRVVELRAKF